MPDASDGRLNLLMLSGDTVLATGRDGVFLPVLEAFSARFARVDVIVPPPAGAVRRTQPFGNVFLHPNPGRKAAQFRHALRTGRALLAARPYALIVSHDYGLFQHGFAACRLSRESGTPYLSELHHVPGHPRAVDLRERLEVPWNRFYARYASRRAAAIRVVNRVEMPALLRSFGVPEDKVRVIPSLYLDHERFRPDPAAAKDVDVLLVGRLVKNKRFDLALDALALLCDRRPGLRARLVGEGPLEAALLARAAKLGLLRSGGSGGRGDGRPVLEHVRFLPGEDALAGAYRAARVLLCTSASEGGPRVTCEAMSCGTPVVSTPVGIMTELVRDGVNGFLVDWDAEAIAARLDELLADPERAARIGAAGRAAVLPFDRARMIGGYADALLALAAEARGAAPGTA